MGKKKKTNIKKVRLKFNVRSMILDLFKLKELEGL
jgi:hypothetical protein